MEKKHFRIILTVISILVVCNVVTLTLLLTNDSKKHTHRPHKEKCFLKSKLDLTEEQSIAFDSIKMKYKTHAKELDKEKIVVINLSGRGDKDIDYVLSLRGERYAK